MFSVSGVHERRLGGLVLLSALDQELVENSRGRSSSSGNMGVGLRGDLGGAELILERLVADEF